MFGKRVSLFLTHYYATEYEMFPMVSVHKTEIYEPVHQPTIITHKANDHVRWLDRMSVDYRKLNEITKTLNCQ